MKKIGLSILIMLSFALVGSTAADALTMSPYELNKALIAAVKKGSAEEVQKLVRAGANVDQTISDTETAGDCDWNISYTLLEYAAKRNYVDIVKEFIRIKAKNDDINKALVIAAEKGYAAVVRELGQAAPKVDALNRALLAAACECWASVITELIKVGADVNYADEYGDTALIKVVRYPVYTKTYHKYRDKTSRSKAIQELIEAGADVGHANKAGSTPLVKAVENHDFDTVQILLQVPQMTSGPYFGFGTKPINYANKDGNTALIRAVQCIQSTYVSGDTAQYDRCRNSQRIVEKLLQTPGIDPHHANKKGDTALTLLKKMTEKMNH